MSSKIDENDTSDIAGGFSNMTSVQKKIKPDSTFRDKPCFGLDSGGEYNSFCATLFVMAKTI